MCGLSGLFHRDPDAVVDATLLRQMNDTLSHRGPDGEGFHLEPGIGLGHRRLSIVDVSGGGQPMFNEDHSVVIVFNGEIYNFPSLRLELQALGHEFRNRCDTEAVVHAWESWGPGCLDRFEGMFAFALWDRQRRQLFIARDRLGKKPLYYSTIRDGTLAFGSELSALAAVPGLLGEIEPHRVDDFFAFGYVPDPHTIFRGVSKLPPAHYILLEHGDVPEPRRYWQPPSRAVECEEGAAIEQLRELLVSSTRKRLMADVPLGAFLSGGVDSSAVVATAASMQSEPLSTFTIGFSGEEDERPLARKMSSRYRTAQYEEVASLDYLDAARRQANIFGEPFGDSSAVPTEAVCKLARRHVTVAVSGDGGDEVFAGYRRYRFHQVAEAVRALLPSGVRRAVIGQLARAYPKMDWAPRWLRAKHTLTELSLESALGFYRTLAKVHHDQRRSLFSRKLRSELDGYHPGDRVTTLMARCDEGDSLLQAQHVDLELYLPSDILVKVDRTSMAHSLEVRAPFLDHDFVAWGMALPASLKLRGQNGKWVLKKALEPIVPADILYRSKQGFATPLGSLFRQNEAKLRRMLFSPALLESGLFDQAALNRLVTEHCSSYADHSGALWLLLTFAGFLEHAQLSRSMPPMVKAA